MIEELLQYNEAFVAKGGYLPYKADKYPRKRLAVLACMDARLIELLPAALGLANGDAKIIKNAGGMILDPYDTAVRSLLIAVLKLKAEEILIIAHTDCGVQRMEPPSLREDLMHRGITEDAMKEFEHGGPSLAHWFSGFETPKGSVRRSVSILKHHPLMPSDVKIHGAVMDVHTGKLTPVEA